MQALRLHALPPHAQPMGAPACPHRALITALLSLLDCPMCLPAGWPSLSTQSLRGARGASASAPPIASWAPRWARPGPAPPSAWCWASTAAAGRTGAGIWENSWWQDDSTAQPSVSCRRCLTHSPRPSHSRACTCGRLPPTPQARQVCCPSGHVRPVGRLHWPQPPAQLDLFMCAVWPAGRRCGLRCTGTAARGSPALASCELC